MATCKTCRAVYLSENGHRCAGRKRPEHRASDPNTYQRIERELAAARKVVECAAAWRLAKKDAEENAHLMLSSARTSDEAAIIMETLFAAERAVIGSLAAYDAAKYDGGASE